MIKDQGKHHLFAPSRQQGGIARGCGLTPRWRIGETRHPGPIAEAALGGKICRAGASTHWPAARAEELSQALAEEPAIMFLHAAVSNEPDLLLQTLLERGAALRRVDRLGRLEAPQDIGQGPRALKDLADR